MNKKAVTTSTIREMKQQGEPITMVTAYDYAMARNVNEAGIEMILVGDSLGNVMLGYGSTVPVTMEEMIHHTKAVMRAGGQALVVADMPFMSYQASIADGLYNAARFLKETGLHGSQTGGRQRDLPAGGKNDAGRYPCGRAYWPHSAVSQPNGWLQGAGEGCGGSPKTAG